MKKALAFLFVICICFSCYGCGADEIDVRIDDVSSEEVEDVVAEKPLDLLAAKANYRFLVSPYTITSTKASMDKIYKCEYYFIEGVVNGIKTTTSFSNSTLAGLYFQEISENDPCAAYIDCNVIHFEYSKDYYFNGYTPEKLIFALENAGYEVVVNFDLNLFNKVFNDKKQE